MPVSAYTIPGMHIRDHLVPVPLDWSRSDESEKIEVFVREVVDPARQNDDLPLLAFLQGGPGGKSPRPAGGGPPWLAEAIKTHRVILPDQRGTGRSSRIEAATMRRFADTQAAAGYLALFRADSIVADFEHVRKTVFGGKRWQTLGQSYGGFLTLTYLSTFPEALSACYVAGGLASLRPSADEVYRRTYPRAAAKTAIFYKRFPHDVERVAALADFIDGNDVRLPDGDRLTVKRLQTIGIDLGMAPGHENVHWLIDEAFSAPGQLSDHFLAAVMTATSYDGNPLFAALQESIYGHGPGATAWAADRIRGERPEFDTSARPLLFTGEMMFPWMFEEIRSLTPFRHGVEALAMRESYPELYDPARLAANEVPVSAIVYHDDLYVDAALSLETAREVGNLTHWVTNEFEHDGIRQSANVFKRLLEMVRERGGPIA
ncbi:MAG: alpha/beta fold hydrolase [Devosia nanyangense]|uniref:Alpha/beta fold hydrolase n=1 Tax=Devosia nanyangense TaxID=1228055 RepID=A0A933NZN6_9HYPH|nr:alpha/beta fold hydrolase [Devosia nanyangense]